MRLLHLHSTFDAGGKELRCVQLINAFGPRVEHCIVSAVPQATAAAKLISNEIPVSYAADFPPLQGKPTPLRLLRIARAMRGYDLVLTYNWGAMDAVMAHALFRRLLGLPPLVHHEDGFNADEARRLKPARNLWRRLASRGAAAFVVPSRRLEHIARTVWRQPAAKVARIANGIAVSRFGEAARPDTLGTLVKQPGERWLGTLAGLRQVKNLPRMVRAFAALPADWRLVIVGEGPERDAILAQARAIGIEGRVHLPGFASDPAPVMALFDLFALSSDSEQFPISVVEAMASGLAVAAPAVGDVAQIVAEENLPFITPADDEGALCVAMQRLAGDDALRARVGAANRARAVARFDEQTMIHAYAALYGRAMGRGPLP